MRQIRAQQRRPRAARPRPAPTSRERAPRIRQGYCRTPRGLSQRRRQYRRLWFLVQALRYTRIVDANDGASVSRHAEVVNFTPGGVRGPDARRHAFCDIYTRMPTRSRKQPSPATYKMPPVESPSAEEIAQVVKGGLPAGHPLTRPMLTALETSDGSHAFVRLDQIVAVSGPIVRGKKRGAKDLATAPPPTIRMVNFLSTNSFLSIADTTANLRILGIHDEEGSED